MEVVASLSQGRTAAAQCGVFTQKSVPVIFDPPCIICFTCLYFAYIRPLVHDDNVEIYFFKKKSVLQSNGEIKISPQSCFSCALYWCFLIIGFGATDYASNVPRINITSYRLCRLAVFPLVFSVCIAACRQNCTYHCYFRGLFPYCG